MYFRNYGLGKRSQINVLKVSSQTLRRQPKWYTCISTAEICFTDSLSFSLVTSMEIVFEKVSLIDMANLGAAC